MTADSRRLFARFRAWALRISTLPPAFSTAATADFEAPNTESATLALISPPPSSRTPSLARRSTPALTRAAASIVPAASSRPASIASCMRPRLTSLSLRANIVLLEAALGQAPMQRHLAALEALDAHAGARGLALAAAAAGLALAGADAAADALALLARAGVVGDFVEFHVVSCPPFDALARPRSHADARPWRSCRASPAYRSSGRGRSC